MGGAQGRSRDALGAPSPTVGARASPGHPHGGQRRFRSPASAYSRPKRSRRGIPLLPVAAGSRRWLPIAQVQGVFGARRAAALEEAPPGAGWWFLGWAKWFRSRKMAPRRPRSLRRSSPSSSKFAPPRCSSPSHSMQSPLKDFSGGSQRLSSPERPQAPRRDTPKLLLGVGSSWGTAGSSWWWLLLVPPGSSWSLLVVASPGFLLVPGGGFLLVVPPGGSFWGARALPRGFS